MPTLQTSILTLVIIVLFIQYCRAATKARALTTAHSLAQKDTAHLEQTLKSLRWSHECDIRAMKRQHKVQEDSLRSMRHTLNGQSEIKCLTFQTRAGGLKRYTVGHSISRIMLKRDALELSVTCFKDNGVNSSTTFKMVDITGPIHIDRG